MLFMITLLQKKLLKILRSKEENQGFSLVELVIVIAVLAILSAVAIPAFQGVQVRAKTAAVKNGLTNGIKECVVSSGLGESTQYGVSQAFNGQYQGYEVVPPNSASATAAATDCYSAEANPILTERGVLPWFNIVYTPADGSVTKTCGWWSAGTTGTPPGCDNSDPSVPPW